MSAGRMWNLVASALGMVKSEVSQQYNGFVKFIVSAIQSAERFISVLEAETIQKALFICAVELYFTAGVLSTVVRAWIIAHTQFISGVWSCPLLVKVVEVRDRLVRAVGVAEFLIWHGITLVMEVIPLRSISGYILIIIF